MRSQPFLCVLTACLALPGCFLDRAPIFEPRDAGVPPDAPIHPRDAANDASRDACVASAEACNGIDDDCDGNTDESLTRDCSSACSAGSESCEGGAWIGCTAIQPVLEVCNNLDDDCNGRIDDAVTRDCSTTCGSGTERCSGGIWMGCDARMPVAETCNAMDDDCNGLIDDGVTRPCTGTCGAGVQTCTGGVFGAMCVPVSTSPEACNGIDDDCNGTIDDGLSRSCRSACGGTGTETCSAGAWVGCTAPAVPPESCNGIDDDCDGMVDDGAGCPCGITSHLGRTYMICASAASWTSARTTCTDNGYDLATIDSTEENTWVFTSAQSVAAGDYWIGLNDTGSEGTFTWASGSTSAFSAWSSDQPSGDPGDQDCAYIEDGSDAFFEEAGLWNDFDCDASLFFVCEAP